MSFYRLVMADSDELSCAAVAEHLHTVADMELIGTVYHSEQVIPAVTKHQPDLLLMDCWSLVQGQALLLQLNRLLFKPKVVIYSAQGSAAAIAAAMAAGADYYMLKPIELGVLVRRLRQSMDIVAAPGTEAFLGSRQQQLAQVQHFLARLGVPVKFKGYDYLSTAISLCIENRHYLTRVMKTLYPTVAQQWHTTPQRVERSIRHALEATWTRGDLDVIYRLFPYSVDRERAKPTNSAFIARIADVIRFEQAGIQSRTASHKLG